MTANWTRALGTCGAFACAIFGAVLQVPAMAAVNITPPNLSGATAGTLPGGVTVSPSGASEFAVQFPVPPGSAGVAPAVGLSYSSQGGAELLGLGWTLTGESRISRCGKTLATDGLSRPVKLDANDAFCLDGKRLILKTGSTTEYRTEVDDLARVTAVGGDTTNGPASWKVESRSGRISSYGVTADSAFLAPGTAVRLTWALARDEDRYGNYVSYQYINSASTGEFYLSRIRYTGNDGATPSPLVAYNAINFVYESRPDPWMGYVFGAKLQRLKRLTTIQANINTAADGSGGTLVRQYKIAYVASATSGRSLVQTISDCDGSGVCLPASTFAWTTRDSAANTLQAAGSGDWGVMGVTFDSNTTKYGQKYQQLPTKVLTGDLNGDGKADLLYGDGTGVWRACLSTGTGFSCSNWAGGPTSGKSEHAVIGDFNGDGKADIAMPPAASGSSVTWQLCLSTGSAFNCTNVQANSVSATRDPQAYVARDMNFDGIDDLFFQGNSYKAPKPFLCLSTGTAFQTCTSYAAVNVYYPDAEAQQVYYRVARVSGDFDGDDRVDEVNYAKTISTAHDGYYQPYLAGDTNFKAVAHTTTSLTDGPIATLGLSVAVDSNGDGYADIHSGRSDHSEICYSKGTADAMDCVVTPQTDPNLAYANSVADYDGDGRPDVLFGNVVSQITGTGQRERAVTWTARLASSTLVIVADFNGDGLPDEAYYIEATQHWMVSLTGSGSHPDLLASVTNGFGLQTQIQYKDLNDPSVYTRGADVSYPMRNQTSGPPVVSLIRVQAASGETAGQWLDTAYTYAGLRTDLKGRGSLGFEKVSSTNAATRVTTTTTYSQAFPTIGMPLTVLSSHPSCAQLSLSTHSLKSIQTITGAYLPYTRQSVLSRKDLDCATMPTATTLVGATVDGTDGIDAYGNVTSSVVTIVDGSDTFTTTTASTYVNNESDWLIGQRADVTVTKGGTGVSSVTRTAHSDFNTKGRVTNEIVEPNDTAYRLETVYEVNPTYGVVTKKTLKWLDPQASAALSRDVETAIFDSKQRYPETVTNAKSQSETRSYDPATGQPLTLTGPNLLTTSWSYDAWGRKVREDRADSTATTWAYKSCIDSCGIGNTAVAVTVIQQWARLSGVDEQTTVPSEVFSDAHARHVFSRTWDTAGLAVLADETYDAKGQLYRVSAPHALADRNATPQRVGWTRYTRDDLGRIVTVETSNLAGTGYDTTTVVHSGTTTTTTNPKSQVRTEVLNGLGKVKRITDANQKSTAYAYDPFGNLLTTTDPVGNMVAVTYDRLGRRTQLADPDLGSWNYKVNPLGQTYQATDAKSQVTTMTFDALGRMTDRVEADQQSHWIYDTATKGVGKIAESFTGPSTAKDYQRLYVYDGLGRSSKTITRLDWDYSTATTYNSYGQVAALVLGRDSIGQTSGGLFQTYGFTYNNQGATYQVNRGTTLLWTRDSQDASGRTTQETFANGLVTKRDFNKWTGRVEGIGTGAVVGGSFVASLQNDAYTYDSLGNVLTRSQLSATSGAAVSETFTYDVLNRLKTSQLGSNAVQTMAYDDLGNVSTKPNVGTYAYPPSGSGSVRPHAVSSITGTVGGLTNPSFSYDANGNLTLGLNRGYTWSAANYPASIDKLTAGTLASAVERDEFLYGPERQRTRQIVRAMSGQTLGAVRRTIFYGEGIEKEVDATLGKTFIRTYLPGGLGYTQETFNSVATTPATAPNDTTTRYFHVDHLGSVNVITDSAAVEQQRLSYDAWGRRRNSNGADDAWSGLGTLSNDQDNTGYTGQEQLDNVGLIHLNGRVYDPMTGRMVSADPTVPNAADLQAWNRYSYVVNSPLGYTDPTGFEGEPQTVSVSAGKPSPSPEWKPAGTLTGSFNDFVGLSWISHPHLYRLAARAVSGFSARSPAQLHAETTAMEDAAELLGTVQYLQGGPDGGDPFTHMVASLPSVPSWANEFTAGFGSSNSYGLTDLQNATAQNTLAYYSGAAIGMIPGFFTGSDEVNGARWLWKLNPCKCFVAGTIVQTKYGPMAIEKLKVGDLVAARDENSGETAFKPVVRLVRNGEKKVVRLTFVNADGKAESLGVTLEHPFMVDGKHWVPAGQLKPGDRLMTLGGGLLTVRGVAKYGVRHHTYNFEVADFHTYFVGSEGAWVHNAGPCPLDGIISFSEKQLQKKFGSHATDFGIERSWGRGAAEEFKAALSAHVLDPATQAISGTYRGVQQVTHFFNPQTGLNVMRDAQGAFVSGWKLGVDQVKNLLAHGNIQ
jgi:RHS repeat-associated protein